PLRRLQVDGEQAGCLELRLDERVLIARARTVVVGVVLQVEVDYVGDASCLKSRGRSLDVGAPVSVAVEVFEHLGRTGQAGGNVGVQRQVRALVDLVRDGLAVD